MATATMTTTKYGTSITGWMIWTSKQAAQDYAKAMGWNKNDVRPAYHKHFGWKGYIVGQLISPDIWRGFAANDEIVEGKIEPRKFP